MLRSRITIGAGVLVGALGSLHTWRAAQAAIAAGEPPAGVGLGVSHTLFFLCLPWSIPVVLAMWVVATITGADGPAFLAPWFYAMPVVAGAGWGAIFGGAWRRARRSTTARGAA